MSTHFREAHTDLETTLGAMAAPHNQLEENLQMEEFVPDHQPESPPHFDNEEEENSSSSEEPFVPTEAEKDAAARLTEIRRPAAKQPVKRPRSPAPVDDDVPDLAEIFDNYDTPKATRISICRAYASYLASTLPKRPKAAPKKKSK